MRRFGLHRLEQRITTVSSILSATGDLRLEDAGRRRRRRRLVFRVEAPGTGMEPLGRFKYEEWLERDRPGWRLVRYHYDFWDLARGGRLGFHLHRLARREPVFHAHCEAPGRPDIEPHFRFYEMDLLEAHAEFVAIYAREEPIDCTRLRPLR